MEADEIDEVIVEFLEETNENLDRLDREFLVLEENPSSRETVASIFRTIHTIKGTCGFLGFDRLESVAHVGESLLCLLRGGDVALTPAMTDVLLEMVDAVRAMMTAIEVTRTDGEESYEELKGRLASFCVPSGPEASIEAPVTGASDEPSDEPTDEPTAVPADEPVNERLVQLIDPPSDEGVDVADQSLAIEPTIRVGVRLLDHLMTLVGELVLARNQVLQFSADQTDRSFLTTTQQLNLITTELQAGVMKTRMQPIGGIFSKFPRIVRDLAQSCHKQVRIEMQGEETELDKTILEAIKDPLTHVLRNSVDHGIELPERRVAAGKPAEGNVSLRAWHEGGQVIIEIADDGAGIDLGAVRAKAIEREIVSREQLASMSDQATAHLIFSPGFSTAAAVTNVSGRGVGMDVVKTNIERIGGTVDVQFVPGRSTTITARIPLTLAIIPALVVRSGANRYLIPQVNLLELLRLDEANGTRGIETVAGAPVYRLRGRLLPIVHLADVLGERSCDGTAVTEVGETDEAPADGVQGIVVVQADGCQFGLVVDDIHDTEEIVVKPLGPHLGSVGAFAGSTIMGDGAVALILDMIGIAAGTRFVAEPPAPPTPEADPGDRRTGKPTSVIVCRVGQERIAIPLALVERLEEVDRCDVEFAGGREVVQYRGRMLTLVHLDRALGAGVTGDPDAPGVDDSAPLQVLVYGRSERLYGLVVHEIIDILEADLTSFETSANPNIEFSAVIGQRVSDLLNIDEIIGRHDRRLAELVVSA